MSTRPTPTSVEPAAAEARRLTVRAAARRVVAAPAAEEALVLDARAGLTPAQAVERKLASLLKGQSLPVSHLLSACRARKPG